MLNKLVKNLRPESTFIAIFGSIFCFWSIAFIYKSSFLVGDVRYFGLFDDAMISMKYAWNLAHGNGLVWARGLYVEGYTNFLWTLMMAVVNFFFEERHAVLTIHLLGIPTVIAVLYASKFLADKAMLVETKSKLLHTIIYILIIISHYPLLYWTLMGMEVGLVTLLATLSFAFLISWVRTRSNKDLLKMSVVLGIAYLVRPDTLFFSAYFIFIYMCTEFFESKNINFLKKSWSVFLPFTASIIFMFIFRYFYYGETVPNTVILKVYGHSFFLRIDNGFRYLGLYLRENYIIFGISLAALVYNPSKIKSLLLSFLFVTSGYQVIAGGDAWPYWRMLVTAIPVTAIGVSAEILHLGQLLTSRIPKFLGAKIPHMAALFSISVTFLIIYTQNEKFIPEILLKEQAYQAQYNEINVKYALALKELTQPQAKVGVFWAGAVPYYSQREGIDFLGKSDKYIASLEPEIPKLKPAEGLIFYPGHNKYDLRYTIIKLKPDVIERADWGSQSAYDDADFHYSLVTYKGIQFLVNDKSELINRNIL